MSTEFDLEQAALKILEANRDLRAHLDSYDIVIQESLEKFRSGQRLRDVVKSMPPADATAGSELAVIEVFEARRALRRALVVILLAEGMTVDEIASTFKVSIESICDFANEVAGRIE